MMNRLAPYLYQFRIPLFALVVIVTVLLASQIRFTMNTRIDAWFTEDDPVLLDYQFFSDSFEGGYSLVVAIEAEDIFSRDVLVYLIEKTSELEQMDSVRRVTSLANANHVIGTRDGLEIRPLLNDIENADLGMIKRMALDNEIFRGYLVSNDARMAAILIVFRDLTTDQIDDILTEVRSRIHRDKPPEIHTFLGGGLMVSNEFIKTTRQNQTILPAMGVIMGMIIIYVLFRSVQKNLILMVQIGMSLVCALGVHSLLGFTYNPVSGMIIPLIVVLSLSNSIHMIEYFDEMSSTRHARASFISTVSYISIACFIASITTACGLLSLSISPIKAVKEFGITAGIGIVFSFFIALFTVPFLLSQLPASRRSPKKAWGHLLSRVSALSEARYKLIIALSCVAIVFALIGLKQIRIDSNELDWFPRDSELYVNSMKLDTHLAGIGNIELVLQGEEEMLMDPEVLNRIDTLSRNIERLPHIRKVISLADYIKMVNRALNEDDPLAYRVPDTRELIAQEVLLFSLSETGTEELEKYASFDYSLGRVSTHLAYTSSQEVRSLVRQIQDLRANCKTFQPMVMKQAYPLWVTLL
ncbi:MAG TPA: hypothetical protein ENN34_12955 [Deltaproteobacteria bacterium]|nr:hypothetical protein [Deltaproteobacteria bacterium]